MTILLLSLLSHRTNQPIYAQKAQKMISTLSQNLIKLPSSAAYLLMAIKNFKNGEQAPT